MKVTILTGGFGSRLAEETKNKPKPMVKIGDRPILWHIMKHYAYYGFNEFVIALGYKGEVIERYIEKTKRDGGILPGWKIELKDTGILTKTGGRIKRLAPHLENETFMLTWGDGLSDVNLRDLLAFHRSHGKLATLTAVYPPAYYGYLKLEGDQVQVFSEKKRIQEEWINGAYFVLEPEVLDYINSDDDQWEKRPMEQLAKEGQLMAYRHTSFWQCMDTLREKHLLEKLWQSGKAPWKIWE